VGETLLVDKGEDEDEDGDGVILIMADIRHRLAEEEDVAQDPNYLRMPHFLNCCIRKDLFCDLSFSCDRSTHGRCSRRKRKSYNRWWRKSVKTFFITLFSLSFS